MKINIGSTNPSKISAVIGALKEYTLFRNATIHTLNVKSEPLQPPSSLDELILTAEINARNSFKNCQYSIGIENGLMNLLGKHFYASACAIYDQYHAIYGISSAFEIHPVIYETLARDPNIDHLPLAKESKIDSSKGIIGLLTKGRLTIENQMREAVDMALINLENESLF